MADTAPSASGQSCTPRVVLLARTGHFRRPPGHQLGRASGSSELLQVLVDTDLAVEFLVHLGLAPLVGGEACARILRRATAPEGAVNAVAHAKENDQLPTCFVTNRIDRSSGVTSFVNLPTEM